MLLTIEIKILELLGVICLGLFSFLFLCAIICFISGLKNSISAGIVYLIFSIIPLVIANYLLKLVVFV